jgi:hypothetical protein
MKVARLTEGGTIIQLTFIGGNLFFTSYPSTILCGNTCQTWHYLLEPCNPLEKSFNKSVSTIYESHYHLQFSERNKQNLTIIA